MEITNEAKKKDGYPSALYRWVNVGFSALVVGQMLTAAEGSWLQNQ